MKTFFTSITLLIAGVVFPANPVTAASAKASDAEPTLAADSAPASGIENGASTNAQANDRESIEVQKQREPLDEVFTPLDEILQEFPKGEGKVRATAEQMEELQKELARYSAPPAKNRTPKASDQSEIAAKETAKASDATAEGKSTDADDIGKDSNPPGELRRAPTNASDGSNAPANTSEPVNLESMETLDDKHRLAIGDKLSFRIEEDKHRLAPLVDKIGTRSEDEPTPLLVTDSGEVEVPYIGRFPAESKTCKQLAHELKAGLEKDYFYHATVILAVDLKTKSRGRVYLTGAVHMPGPQEIPSDEVLTLGKAILRAGGFTDFAERHNVKVTRKAENGPSANKTLVVDVAQVFDKGKTERDLPLEPGDLITVAERMIRF